MTLLYPKSRDEWLSMRHRYIGSTDSPALFDCGYSTRLQLYYEKLADAPTAFEATERMEFGLINQRGIATYIARKYGIKVRALNALAVLDSRMSSSFDYEIIGEDSTVKDVEDDSLRLMYRDKGPGLLEIKNVDWMVFRDEWPKTDGGYEAPPQIEIQMQHELHTIDRSWGCLGVCVGGNRLEMLIRTRNEDVGQLIAARVKLFWHWIERKEPPPERMPEDYDLLKQVYSHAEPGKVLDATDKPQINTLLKAYALANAQIARYEAAKKVAHADLLKLIGDAEKVIGTEYNVSCSVVAPARIEAHDRAGYRTFRVTARKVKKDAPL